MSAKRPDLDTWLPDPAVRVAHCRESAASPERLWRATQGIGLSETRLLGRLIRWRIPGLGRQVSFDELFRQQPFTVLCEGDGVLVSGLVGRIWTLRRDYPELDGAEEFREWSTPGTARVLFANWVEPAEHGGAALHSETRVEGFGPQGRIGLASVRPLIRGFQQLVANDAMATAVRRAERG
jgi:hypothetical protein